MECQCYRVCATQGTAVLSFRELSVYKVSLKDMIYRTLSLSYMFGQCIYVIFLSVSLIL